MKARTWLWLVLNVLSGSRFAVSACAFFLGVGAVLLLGPSSWWPRWFFPRLTGVGTLAYVLLVLTPALLYPMRADGDAQTVRRKRKAARLLQVVFAISALLALLGTLGLYRLHRMGVPYDKVLHFIVPVLVTWGLARFVQRWRRVPVRRSIGLACLWMFAAAVAWELTEWGSDRVFGTAAFGQEGRDVVHDTAWDLGLDVLGIGLAATTMALVQWRRGRA